MSTTIINPPSYAEYKGKRFLIMDAPSDSNVPAYIEVLKKKGVVTVVRACDPSYDTAPLLKSGINVVELPFKDGDPPPIEVLDAWLDIVDSDLQDKKNAIAVHCVAGLGRAPILVTLALIELGMEAHEAIAYIRKRRRGAINTRQLTYLESYKRRKANSCCVIS